MGGLIPRTFGFRTLRSASELPVATAATPELAPGNFLIRDRVRIDSAHTVAEGENRCEHLRCHGIRSKAGWSAVGSNRENLSNGADCRFPTHYGFPTKTNRRGSLQGRVVNQFLESAG